MKGNEVRQLWNDGRTGPLARTAANLALSAWESKHGEHLESAPVGRAGAAFEGAGYVLLGRTSDVRSLSRSRGQLHFSAIFKEQFEDLHRWALGRKKEALLFLVSYGGPRVHFLAIPWNRLNWEMLPKREDGSAFIKVFETEGRLELSQTTGALDVTPFAEAVTPASEAKKVGVGPPLPFFDWRSRITIDSARRSGKPCIAGTRITVYDILEYLASGMSQDEVLDDFPDLAPEDIRAALAFAADQGRRVRSIPA